ncbi:MAG TPA: SDR family NAD(P)-dependent oxidoreductase [Balneolales bacterium]|nr:SDR family NAD(P)-dependent oxidoreductase [Balneolales bacterium]
MKHYIITGASRGFGRYLAEALAEDNTTFHLVARSNMREVQESIENKGGKVHVHHADLSDTHKLPGLNHDIFKKIDRQQTEYIVLVNNAGMLEPVGPVGKYDPETYRRSLEVNFTAPLLLTYLFVHAVQDWTCRKQVVMISSGAAIKAYYGWSNYCSTKAGLNRFTETLALEQKGFKHPVEAFAFNPGRIDTQMQNVIREQSADDFPLVDDFIRSKEKGHLGDPVKIAAKLVRLMNDGNVPAGKMIVAAEME